MSESQKTQIIDLCNRKGQITSTDLKKHLGIETSNSLSILRKMVKENILKENKIRNRPHFRLIDKQRIQNTLPISQPSVLPTTTKITSTNTLVNLQEQVRLLSLRLDSIESLLGTFGLQRTIPIDPEEFQKALIEEYKFINPSLDITGVELLIIRRRVARKLRITEELFTDYLFDLQQKNSNFRSRRGREKAYLAISPVVFG